MSPLDRRSFLVRSGLLLGAAAAGGGVLGAPATARPTARLAGWRRETYIALVGAVAATQSPHLGTSYAEAAAERFAGWYRAGAPHLRAGVDALLDAVEKGEPGGFSAASRSRRLSSLRRWSAGDARERALTAEAIVLASPPFGESGDELPQTPVAL